MEKVYFCTLVLIFHQRHLGICFDFKSMAFDFVLIQDDQRPWFTLLSRISKWKLNLNCTRWSKQSWSGHDGYIGFNTPIMMRRLTKTKILIKASLSNRDYQQWLATIILITVGDYCSVTPGVLQISTTTKNSLPEN